MAQMVEIVKVTGVTKDRDRGVVTQQVDDNIRKNFFFLDFSPTSLGGVGRLFQYRLLITGLTLFMVMPVADDVSSSDTTFDIILLH